MDSYIFLSFYQCLAPSELLVHLAFLLLLSFSVSEAFKNICAFSCVFSVKGWSSCLTLTISTASDIRMNRCACCISSPFYFCLQGKVSKETTSQELPCKLIQPPMAPLDLTSTVNGLTLLAMNF